MHKAHVWFLLACIGVVGLVWAFIQLRVAFYKAYTGPEKETLMPSAPEIRNPQPEGRPRETEKEEADT